MLVIPVCSAFCINAQDIDNLLSTKAVTYNQAIWLILKAADIQDINNPEAAFNHVGYLLPAGTDPDDFAKLNILSLVIMQSFDMKGGIMYTLRKNARYAYRELLFRNIIRGRTDPDMLVSGEQLLYYINNVLARQEDVL